MNTLTLPSTAPFCIEDNILNIYDGAKLHSFYLSQIEKMYLEKRKFLKDAGVISQWLHNHLNNGYRLHILSTDGDETIIAIRNADRQAFIELISQIRKSA